MIEYSNDDFYRFPNVGLVDSNLDEIRFMKLTCWKENLEGRLDSLWIISMKVSNEEECDDAKCLVTWVKVE